ncbi:MAG: type II toxin-antitoxin system CcdA family antitoxin [Desulfuromonadaceae bacterium]|nr:type II toxin-antitoxin system CcdA family antitoxin [Desulfuromonadaceae bacterium]MDD5105176.1 type II toxin-antitoxin system CcdA family antitoxin [Desulfuromonadaceae bacterium]
MTVSFYNHDAPKQTAHVSINSDLLRQAKAEKINLSQTVEKLLATAIRDKKRQEWLDNSCDAIEEYRQFVEKNGCFGDALRCF